MVGRRKKEKKRQRREVVSVTVRRWSSTLLEPKESQLLANRNSSMEGERESLNGLPPPRPKFSDGSAGRLEGAKKKKQKDVTSGDGDTSRQLAAGS